MEEAVEQVSDTSVVFTELEYASAWFELALTLNQIHRGY